MALLLIDHIIGISRLNKNERFMMNNHEMVLFPKQIYMTALNKGGIGIYEDHAGRKA